jgi:hypothetical protein
MLPSCCLPNGSFLGSGRFCLCFRGMGRVGDLSAYIGFCFEGTTEEKPRLRGRGGEGVKRPRSAPYKHDSPFCQAITLASTAIGGVIWGHRILVGPPPPVPLLRDALRLRGSEHVGRAGGRSQLGRILWRGTSRLFFRVEWLSSVRNLSSSAWGGGGQVDVAGRCM